MLHWVKGSYLKFVKLRPVKIIIKSDKFYSMSVEEDADETFFGKISNKSGNYKPFIFGFSLRIGLLPRCNKSNILPHPVYPRYN